MANPNAGINTTILQHDMPNDNATQCSTNEPGKSYGSIETRSMLNQNNQDPSFLDDTEHWSRNGFSRCTSNDEQNCDSSSTRTSLFKPCGVAPATGKHPTDLMPLSPLTDSQKLDLGKSMVNHDPENPQTPLGGHQTFKFTEIPRRSKLTLMVTALANFGAGCAFSLPAPFFPREAAEKGATPLMIGIVFSSYEFVTVLMTPIFGNFVAEIGPKFLCAAGMSAAGCSSILFGFLDLGPGGMTFILTALMVRTVEAMGISAFETASFAVISAEFPDHISSAFSILETFQGIGYMTGATVGGVLYSLGGFGFPFWVTGAFVFGTGILFLACLPPPKKSPSRREGHILSLLRSPLIWVAMLIIISGSSSLGFLNPTLTLHLQQYGLSVLEASLFFIIAPTIYALTSPLWGYLSDSRDIQAPMMMWACFACGSGFLMVGPTPLLPFLPKQLWFITIGYILYGLGIGCCIIPTMKCIVIGARELGFADNISTFGMVSGLFNCNFHLGCFFGPTVAGYLVERMGFEYSATLVAAIFAITIVVVTMFFGVRKWRMGRRGNPSTNQADNYNKQTTETAQSGNDAPPEQNQTPSEITPIVTNSSNISVSSHAPQAAADTHFRSFATADSDSLS